MIPGKKYKPEDFLEIAWRRKWVIVVPLAVLAIGTFLWDQRLPNQYRSEALVVVIAPQVPANYVSPIVSGTLQERLQSMRQRILSRTNLERIILELNLYAAERKRLLMDEVVDQMRRDVNLTIPRLGRRQQPGSFTISYLSTNPRAAMLVTEQVASLFVRENLEGRSIQADATNQFLQRQLDEALRRLKEHEAKLEAFRRANAGRLPDEVERNLQVMQGARTDLQSLTDSMTRDRDRQMAIERTIAEETASGPVASAAPASASGRAPGTAAHQLAATKALLVTLELRLTQDHPDVRATKRRIDELEQKASEEALLQPVSEGVPAGPVDAAQAAHVKRLAALRTEFDNLDRNIGRKRAQAERLQASVELQRSRVELAPALQSQLTNLMRDYGTFQGTYTDLLKKTETAKLASNLEQQQVGEQFRVIDPPRLPERPSSPDRVRMNLMGALAGLGIGLALAGLLEYRDTSLRTEEDILVALSLPVVALVPTIWTRDERQRARRRRLLLGSSLAATLVVSAAAVAWKLRLFENWVQ